MLWNTLRDWIREADRKAWRLHRAGGAVIGLALIYHLSAGAVRGAAGLLRQEAALEPPHCCPPEPRLR